LQRGARSLSPFGERISDRSGRASTALERLFERMGELDVQPAGIERGGERFGRDQQLAAA